MKKLIFDIDGTVADLMSVFVYMVKVYHNIDIAVDQLKYYSLEESTGLSKEQVDRLVDVSIRSVNQIKPYSNAITFLYEYWLQTKKESLIFVTSRKEKYFREPTLEWFNIFLKQNLNIGYKIYYSSTKAEIIKQYNANYLIDDCPKVAENVARNGHNVLMMSRPWNQNMNLWVDRMDIDNIWKARIMKLKNWESLDWVFNSWGN